MDFALSLTHDCNLACTYCYSGRKTPRVMSWDVAERAMEFAFSFEARDVRMAFFGGEPLMHRNGEWDLLVRCTEHAEDLAERRGVKLRKQLTTNGTLITSDRIAWMKAHGLRPDVSIDGNRAMHEATRPFRGGGSSFDAVLRGLRLVLDAFPGAGVVIVPDPANVEHLADGVRYLVERERARRVFLNPNFYAAWDDRARSLLRRGYEAIGDLYVERFRAGSPVSVNVINGKIIGRLQGGLDVCSLCGFAEREIAVAPSGRIYPCERLIGEDAGGEACIGSVINGPDGSDGSDGPDGRAGFDEEKRRALLAPIDGSALGCDECPSRSRCMNWCRAINYTLTGSAASTGEIVCFHERLAMEVADRAGGILIEEGNEEFARLFGGF